LKSGSLNLLEPSTPVTGLDTDCFTFCFGIRCYILFEVCVHTHLNIQTEVLSILNMNVIM
jgi:hypothetical protein